MINVFIGYDSKEKVAYDVLSYSILHNSSEPVSITPVYKDNLKHIIDERDHSLASTEFSFSRFIVPYLMNYSGFAIFMDCDMLMVTDIKHLWDMRDKAYSVQVCKHNYVPRTETKFLGQTQSKYEKKNWSSLMIMNCEACKSLTPDYINTASGLELHQFKWLGNDDLIGALPISWNWLAGEYPELEPIPPYNIHYTLGGPWWEDYKNGPYSDIWNTYYQECTKINLK